MKKILVVASSYYCMRIFLLPHLRHLVEKGWTVHVSSANDGEAVPYAHKQIDIPICRSPFRCDNLKAVKVLAKHIENERYDIVHCHTPIGAMVARLAARKARRSLGTKVIYTTHGLHFYKDAPLKNWLLYYTAEKAISPLTDAIITINEEDRSQAARYFPSIKQQFKISGIGYDAERFKRLDLSRRDELRREYGYDANDFICVYLARFCDGKNHQFLLSNMPATIARIPNVKYIFLGEGETIEKCQKLASAVGVQDKVRFEGFKTDITDCLAIADVGISSSEVEGLGMGLIEEMYAKLPVLASDVRGHRELIEDGKNGLLFPLDDAQQYIRRLEALCNDPQLRKRLGEYASQNIDCYRVENVIKEMDAIYDLI